MKLNEILQENVLAFYEELRKINQELDQGNHRDSFELGKKLDALLAAANPMHKRVYHKEIAALERKLDNIDLDNAAMDYNPLDSDHYPSDVR